MGVTDDELLARNPDAAGLIAAGVPRDEVLQGLRNRNSQREPDEPEAAAAPPIARTASIARQSTAPLPAGWEERFDPGTGRKFYLNSNTRETTWTRPREEAAPLYPSAAATPRSWDLAEISTPRPSGAVAPEATALEEASAGTPGKKNSLISGIGGLFGFGKKKEKPKESDALATAPEASAVTTAAIAADVDALLVIIADTSLPTPKRVDAASAVSNLIKKVQKEGETTTEPSAATIKDGSLALRLVDALGAISEAPLQAALCRAIWLLAEAEAVKAAIADGGGILYLGAPRRPSPPSASLTALAAAVEQPLAHPLPPPPLPPPSTSEPSPTPLPLPPSQARCSARPTAPCRRRWRYSSSRSRRRPPRASSSSRRTA